MELFAVKLLSAAIVVLALSIVAERVSPRVAGFLTGAPLGALITYYFVAKEAGIGFVVASVPHAVAGLSGTVLFVYLYYRSTQRMGAYGPLVGSAVGLAGYFAVAFLLLPVEFTKLTALAVIVPSIILASFGFRRIENIVVRTPVRLTPALLVLRAGSAATLVGTVASIAEALGTAWAGILVAFPMTLLPTMVIIHLTYSSAHVYTMLRSFPLGLGSLITYLLAITITFPAFGADMGTVTGLLAAFAYIGVVSVALKWRQRRFRF